MRHETYLFTRNEKLFQASIVVSNDLPGQLIFVPLSFSLFF